MAEMNQAKNPSSGKNVTATSVLGFLVRSVIAGLALAFIILYLWPNISERINGPAVVTSSVPAAPASYADAVDRAEPVRLSEALGRLLRACSVPADDACGDGRARLGRLRRNHRQR